MFGTTATQVLAPVAARPPVYGLLVAAQEAAIDPEDWAAGSTWLPELTATANESGAIAVDCIGDTADGMTRADAASPATMQPFGIFASDSCTARGYRAADYAGRARRRLLATQSYHVAKELWSGAINTAETLGNRQLNSTASDEMTTAGVAVDLGFGLVEQGISYYGHGRQGMIHCTPQALFAIQLNGGVQYRGGLWITPMGNIVVADAGYDGSAPGGGAASTTQWIYGTEILDYVLSPIIDLPMADAATDPAGFMAEALDRTTDKVTVYSARMAAVRWDLQIHVAAQINLAVPAYGGA